MINDKDIAQIKEVIEGYFKGTYHGDANQLKQVFHPEARITGSINGQIVDWSLNDFITRVTTKPTAAEKNEEYNKEILFIDKTHHAAMAKAKAAVGPLVFIDYITLLKINDRWVIRSKSFTN